MKRIFEGEVIKDVDQLYKIHVVVPIKIVKEYKAKKIKRIMAQFGNSDAVHAGFIPGGNDKYFLITNKELLKKCGLDIGSKVTVTVWPDTSRYGMEICVEMTELLAQDLEGEILFHKLTDGKLRSLLYKVNGYKSSDKRLEKGIIILEHLKANAGKLDWKMLNEAFKIVH